MKKLLVGICALLFILMIGQGQSANLAVDELPDITTSSVDNLN